MSKYLQHIIRYFFYHNVSEDLKDRVHKRMVESQYDADSEKTFRAIWDKIEENYTNHAETEKAYSDVSTVLFGRKAPTIPLSLLRIAAIWAIPILMLSGSVYLFLSANHQIETMANITMINKYTANGKQELVILPDCTKVWLNGGSVLIYPSAFFANERNVSLSGEAFFDVKKDAEHPFTVHMNKMKLKVLGTSFNASSYPDNPEITATLRTGKIQITIEGQKKDYILKPSDQLVYNSETGRVNISQVVVDDYTNWRDGLLYFNDVRFSDAVKQLERTYNVKVHLLSSTHNDEVIHAHFNPNERIEHVMEIIKLLIPDLNYEIKGVDIFIQ